MRVYPSFAHGTEERGERPLPRLLDCGLWPRVRVVRERRNRAQIFIDGAQIPVRHVTIHRPGHHLQQRADLRVLEIEISALAHHFQKLVKRQLGR